MTAPKKPSALTRRTVELPYGQPEPEDGAAPGAGRSDRAEATGAVDDTWVDELVQVPGLSAAVARNVAAQFTTPDELAAASVQELAAVPGVGRRLAETLQSFAASTRPVMFGLDLTASPPAPDGLVTAKISRRAHRLLDDIIYFVRREHDIQMDKQGLLGLIIEAFAEANHADLEASGWRPWGN